MHTARPPVRPSDGSGDPTERRGRRTVLRLLFIVGAIAFVAFWSWALFFASKEAVNRIDDRAWATRAEGICAEANTERLALADFRRIVDADPALIRERARIVDASTDVIERMLSDVVAVEPSDEKGRAIVPMWEADYRTYLQDRRNYADQLRESGENLPFYETEIGIPISEKIETFAGDNDISSCAPPRDLTR